MDKIIGWFRERVVLLLAAPVLTSAGTFFNALILAVADGKITDDELHHLVTLVDKANGVSAVINILCLLAAIYLLKKDK